MWPEPKERFGRLKEAVELIRALWTGDRVSFEGSYYRTRTRRSTTGPSIPCPSISAASGPAATRLAGRVADGFICTSGKARELYTTRCCRRSARAPRRPAARSTDMDLMIEVKVSFDPDRSRALDDTRHWAALALSPAEKTGVEDPIEMERLADALPVERAASRWIVSEDPDEHVARIGEYVDLGFRHLVFHAPGPDQSRFLRLYGSEILPRLRKLEIA